MPSHQDRISVGVLIHGFFQTSCQILLECGVLDDGDLQGIVESQHAFALAAGDTLDLFDVADLEASVRTLLTFHKQCDQNSPLGVSVDTAARTTFERSKEQRRTRGWLQLKRLADILALIGGILGGGKLQDEDVFRFHQLFLNARRRNEDVIIATDGGLFE